ncbi:hypothetical protein O181_006085 [Austropuccinia psidii MF-1]|uniref:SNF2 N-terminal domain-containing protein n=1 Tax=Austropuccinia psidii MF-1 TaxID=1389203 RepID=A0A9Q3BJN5_9BASI|nr:hypothetical protein [Austropuccinia psidii MF-1]
MLWKNQNNIFVCLSNQQHTIGSLSGTLSNMLIPFLGAPQAFMHYGPGGEWIENCQSHPTEKLFVEGVLMTDQYDPSSSQNPNLALIFFTWYPNILFIIEIFGKQDFKLQIPKEYDFNSHSKCQIFTPTTPTPNLTPPSYPAVFFLSSKQKLIQLPSRSDLSMKTPPHSMINTALLPHQKTGLSFLWDQEIPNGQLAHSLWATSPPGSTFKDRNIVTNKVVSSFKSLPINTPLGGLLADDLGLGKTIQAIALIGNSKEQLITTPHCSRSTIIIFPPCLITNWKSEISKHAQAGALKANIYHGPPCHSQSKANILQCDIFITSYNTITQEFKQTNTSK